MKRDTFILSYKLQILLLGYQKGVLGVLQWRIEFDGSLSPSL